MSTITARIPDKLSTSLQKLAKETRRTKGYIIQRALEVYLETKSDILIAMARIEQDEDTISLEEIEKKYDLEN